MRTVFLIFFGLVTGVIFSQQNKKEVLFTVEGEPVYVSEFLRVYEKNLDLVQDEGKKDMDSYLGLFVDYKLKLKEAYAQGLHETPEYKKEFAGYQDQLSQNYLYDKEVTEELVREAYDRLREEVNASHILIRVGPEDKPEDTLRAFNLISEIRQKAMDGEDFETLARTYSEEPGAKERAGNLGYFKGFMMVYPFENAAYATPVGEVSEIVRTRFGYHILKVSDRREVPREVTVAHIMISTRGKLSEEEAENRIKEIEKKLKQGEDFEALAKQFSDDTNTAKQGGRLARFGSGNLNAPEFEQAAFALQNPGDISAPVKSDFGWHLIQLKERHPESSLEDLRESLEKRVKDSDRSQVIEEAVNRKIKDRYGFQKEEDALAFFNLFVTDSILSRKWKYEDNNPGLDKMLMTVGDKKYIYRDFAGFLSERQKTGPMKPTKAALLKAYYEEFEEEKLKSVFRERLEEENEEYAAIISEYRDGMLIFELMQKNIWEKSKNDSLGLRTFFKNNQKDYVWQQRADVLIVSTPEDNMAVQAAGLLKAGKGAEEIKEELNTEDRLNVLVTSGIFEIGHPALPKEFVAVTGVSEPYAHNGTFSVIQVNEVLQPAPKELEEVRGKVISDYQAHLEKEWMEELRKKYKVTVNKRAVKKLKKG